MREWRFFDSNSGICVTAEDEDVVAAKLKQKCIHVRIVGVVDVQWLAGIRRVARDEHEAELASTRVVHEEPYSEEPGRGEEERASGGFPGRDGASRKPEAHAFCATSAGFSGQSAPEEHRAIRVGELLATETPRFLETSGESAAQHETTRQNKQRIIF